MKYLDNIVEPINTEIIKGYEALDLNVSGLVTAAKNSSEPKFVDKEGKNVHLNSDKKINIYHRVGRVRSEAIKAGGKKVTYNVNAEFQLVCFTSCRDFDEVVLQKMSLFPIITSTLTDYDAYKILQNEIGAKAYDFNNKYIFVVNYNTLYQSPLCVNSDVALSTCFN
jgi:hypothetical protein